MQNQLPLKKIGEIELLPQPQQLTENQWNYGWRNLLCIDSFADLKRPKTIEPLPVLLYRVTDKVKRSAIFDARIAPRLRSFHHFVGHMIEFSLHQSNAAVLLPLWSDICDMHFSTFCGPEVKHGFVSVDHGTIGMGHSRFDSIAFPGDICIFGQPNK